MEEKDVMLTIKGSIKESIDDHESVELQTEAKSYQEDGVQCLSYLESELFGMEGTTTVIKVKDDQVSIIRLGTVNSLMEFEKGKRNVTLYSTPYGEISMCIHTENINIVYDDDGEIAQVTVEYAIEIGGVTETHNTMDIKVQRL